MKVLIVGLGSIGQKHMHAIKALYPFAELFALRSSFNTNAFPEVTNVFNFDDIRKIPIDFAIVSNPTSEHLNTISELIPCKFPLFIEKPVFSSLEIGGVLESIKNHGINTYVACNLRFLDCIRFVKDAVAKMQNRSLNEVNVYCGSYLPDWRPGTNFKRTYSANVELGGGVHTDLIHELDYLYWIFGQPRSVAKIFKSQSSLSISSYDYANYTLVYEGFCASVVLNYYRRDPKRSLELVFSNETWEVDLLKNQVKCNNQILFESDQRIVDTYQDQMKYFIDAFRQRNFSFNSIHEAYKVLKICLDNDTDK